MFAVRLGIMYYKYSIAQNAVTSYHTGLKRIFKENFY